MANIEGRQRAGSKPIPEGVTRRTVQSEVLAQVVYDLSRILEELCVFGPSPHRVDLRTGRWRLLEAYPRLRGTDSDLAQAIAEEDGHAQDY